MAVKRKNQSALPDALANAALRAFEDGEYEALDTELANAIGAASNAKALRQLIFDPALGQASLGDDGFGATVAEALVSSAVAFTKGDDKAQALAIAVRLCSAERGAVCSPEAGPGDEHKGLFRKGLEQRLGDVRQLLGARATGVKAAAAAVMAVVSLDESDGAALLALAKDKDGDLAATGLIGAANIALRTGSTSLRTGLVELGASIGKKKPLIVKAAAAVALHRLGEEAPIAVANALVDALTSSEPLPSAWGWYADELGGKPAALSELAARFAKAIPAGRRAEIIQKLAAKRVNPDQAALLLSIAFPPGSISSVGVIPSRLDDEQRKVLSLFCSPPLSSARALLVPLGYQSGAHLKQLLEETGPLWAPIPAPLEGVAAQVPPVAVLRGVVYGELSPDAAFQALTEALGADVLIGLLTDPMRTPLSSMSGRIVLPEGNDRLQELLLRLWQALESQDGLTPEALELRAAEGKDAVSEGLLLLWHVSVERGGAADLPPEIASKINKAAKLARGKEPFKRLIGSLPKAKRAQLEVPS